MGLYNKLSQQMVYDLLNASNTLPIPIDSTQAKFGPVSVVVPQNGAIQDTAVKVIALASGQYVGNQALTYRRLDMTVLFRSVPLRVDLYSPTATNISPFLMSQLLGFLNSKYGLNLQASDIVDIAFPAGNTNAVPAIGLPAGTRNSVAVLTMQTLNPAWKGALNVYWVQAPQDLGTLLSTPNLEHSLTYPGQLDTVSNAVYVPNMDVYYQDFTTPFQTIWGTAASIPAWTNQPLATSITSASALIAAINAASGKTYTIGQGTPAGSQLMDLTTAQITRVDLTTAANQALYPEADFRYYTNMLIIKLQSTNPWGAGDMMLHYNLF